MSRIFALFALCGALVLAGCAGTPEATAPAAQPAPAAAAPATATEASQESRKLAALFDDFFEKTLELNPMLATSIGDPRYNDRYVVSIAPEAIARERQHERDFLARIQAIDRSQLTPQEQLSYDIFRSAREREIDGFRFPRELIPFNQFYSTPNSFAQLGSGNGMQPFKTVADYDDFLSRLDGLVQWTD